MIISASRRTDLPNYYSEWFFNRIKDGFVYVRNPMNLHQVSKVKITPDVVDCIVFWSKNPAPLLDKLERLQAYHYYFQFTLTSYGKDIEAAVPLKGQALIGTFQRLSDTIGREKVIWRYDPILLNEKYSIEYHVEYFAKLAEKLCDYTEKCTVSFLDFYRNTTNHVKDLHLAQITTKEKRALASRLVQIANSYDLRMDTCAEDIELDDLGIEHARCIDERLIERIVGCKINTEKDKNQRLECGCVASIDIGMYNTCLNGCKYCYANFGAKTVQKNFASHDENAPLACGRLTEADHVKERFIKSLKEAQYSLF